MNLINELPLFYQLSDMKSIQDSLSKEAENINSGTTDVLEQFFINSATFGLDYWERMLGIPKNNFDDVTRRENIKAKIRSRGTTTMSVIKNICEAYSNGIVEVIVNHSEYSFIIDFVGTIGIPNAFAELDKVIEEIKPCHLGHSYKFNYNTHKDLSNYTHEHLANYTHDEVRKSSELRGGRNG